MSVGAWHALAQAIDDAIRSVKRNMAAKHMSALAGGDRDSSEAAAETEGNGELLDQHGQISLLWPQSGLKSAEPAILLPEEAIRDLELDTILAKIPHCHSSARAIVREVLTQMTDDAEVIRYRQDVFADIWGEPSLRQGLEHILDQINLLGMHHQHQSEQVSVQGVSWRLSELEVYVSCVSTLTHLLGGGEFALRSAGLQRLGQLVSSVAASPSFQQLAGELPGLIARIRRVGSLTVGINLDNNLEPVGAMLLDVRTKRFREPSLLRLLAGQRSNDQPPMPQHQVWQGAHGRQNLLDPLFQDLSLVMERISKPVMEALAKYIRINKQFLASLSPELSYYLNAARLMDTISAAGLQVCRPDILGREQRTLEIDGLYNISLALQTASNGGQQVIANDARLDPETGIAILTGPNRGGKTTFTQAVGQAQVFAQAGLPVPGIRARISPVDGLFTHFPAEERIERGTGRFGDEARRLSEIFDKLTRHGLLLMNESLSGTAAGESLYLAQDIVKVLRRLGARTVFATHLHELAGCAEDLNREVPGDSIIFSLVSSKTGNAALGSDGSTYSFHVSPAPPLGRSYAKEIARRYGISSEQLLERLEERNAI